LAGPQFLCHGFWPAHWHMPTASVGKSQPASKKNTRQKILRPQGKEEKSGKPLRGLL